MKALSLAATLAFAAMPLLATPALAGSSPQDIAARYGITSGSNVGAMMQAAQFATRARHGLAQGSPDWQRANDIVAIAVPAAREQQQR